MISREIRYKEYLAVQRWKLEYICPKCGYHHAYRLTNWLNQCVEYHYQTSVTVLYKTQFLAFQYKHSISVVQLVSLLGGTTRMCGICSCASVQPWDSRTKLINSAVQSRFMMCTLVSRLLAKSRSWKKAKVLVALSLGNCGNPLYIKIQMTKNVKRALPPKFVCLAFMGGSEIRSDHYHSYIPALGQYTYGHKIYNPRFRPVPLVAYHNLQHQSIHSGYLLWPVQGKSPVLLGRVLF